MPPEAQAGRALLKSSAVARHAVTLLVAGLLAATATAFAVTERLKLEDSPVLGTQIDRLFSPVCKQCKPEAREAKIQFRLRREENIRLDIADSNGTIVRRGVGAGVFGQSFHTFAWDGRNDAGHVVPDGFYTAELTLVDEKRTFDFPQEIQVDTTPPTIEVDIRHPVFSPDGDGRADRVDLRYRFSEPAYSILYLDGKKKRGGAMGTSRSTRGSGTAEASLRVSTGWHWRRRIWPAMSRLRPASSQCTSATSSSRRNGMSPAAGRSGCAFRPT